MTGDDGFASPAGRPSIRRATQADWPAISRFLRAAYGPLAQYKGRERWDWQFVSNPMLAPAHKAPTVWIAVAGDRVVGQMAVQIGRFWFEQEAHAGGWIVDVMVLPAYRGQQLGHLLYAAVADEVPLLMMLTMAPATRRMADHAGAVTLNPAMQFSRWTDVRADDVRRYSLHRLGERPKLHAIASIACDRLQVHRAAAGLIRVCTALRIDRPAQNARGLEIEEVTAFGRDFDDFWLEVSRTMRAAAVRDAAYLTWRFQQPPDLHYRFFVARRAGSMAGYMILRRTGVIEQRLGVISDLLTRPGDIEAIQALVSHAVTVFGKSVSSVECVTTRSEIAGLLRRNGFYLTRTTHGTCSSSQESLRKRMASVKDAWYFTKSDHDWDQVQIA